MRLLAPAREARIALAYSVFYIVMSAVTGLVQRTWPAPILGATYLTSDAWYTFGYKIGLLLLLPILWLRRAGYGIADFLAGWRATPLSLASVAAAFVAGLAINAGLLRGIEQALKTFHASEAALRVGLGTVLMLFAAGIPEELVYRGVLQTRLERVWGRLPAVLATAILFMGWHLPSRYLLASGAEGTAGDARSVLLGTGVPVLIVGLALGLAWDRWRNLPALIALHWGVDVLPSVSSFLQLPPAGH